MMTSQFVLLFYIDNYGYGKTLLLVVLCLLFYCFLNFMYSLFYERAMTTTKLPLVGLLMGSLTELN